MTFKYLNSNVEYDANVKILDSTHVKIEGDIPIMNSGFEALFIDENNNTLKRTFENFTKVSEQGEGYVIFEYVKPISKKEMTIEDLSNAIQELAELYSKLSTEV